MDVGPDGFCPGCTNFTENVTDLASLAEDGVAWATVSDMPLAQIAGLQGREGLGPAVLLLARHHVLRRLRRRTAASCSALFLRDGDEVFRTYTTTSRGVDRLMFVQQRPRPGASYGRQEDWEDSPAGWPQHPTYG